MQGFVAKQIGINTDQISKEDISDPKSSQRYNRISNLQVHQNSKKTNMYKLMLLIVAALALVAVASAQVLVYPQAGVPLTYTYPYAYNYPLSYYTPYTLLRR